MAQPYFNYPPVQKTIDATVREVIRCTKDDIRINTFMLDATQYLQTFIEKISRMNGGRAYLTTPETMGEYVLVDFVERKRGSRTKPRRSRVPRRTPPAHATMSHRLTAEQTAHPELGR